MTFQVVARVSFMVLLLMVAWRVYHQQSAWKIFQTVPGLEGALLSVSKDPAPEFHYQVGLLTGSNVDYQDLEAASLHLRTAVRLNGFDWRYWIQLARTSEAQGDLEEAERAYHQAVRLNPRSASYHWHLANFQFRRGGFEEAARHADAAITLNPAYRVSWLVLLKRVGDWKRYVQEQWPQDKPSRLLLLNFLTREEQVNPGQFTDALRELWSSFVNSDKPPSFEEAGSYLALLLQRGHFQESRQVWLQLADRFGFRDEAFRHKGNFVWNGSFEFPLLHTLNWRIYPRAGYAIERKAEEGVRGSHALRISFDGTRNLDFRGLSQIVVVDSGKDYRFCFQARSKALSTEEGLYFQVIDRRSGSLVASSPPISGTTPWTSYAVSFRVPESSESLEILLRRNPSRRISNLIEGVLWIDTVRLEPLPGHSRYAELLAHPDP
jgi:tetratricopeptide (TPR) repeat protein